MPDDRKIPPAMPEVRDLTDDEYDETYADGTGGHELPPHILALLDGDMPEKDQPE